MNDDTRFILRRMEALEGRVMDKIDDLMAFKNKALGIIMTISFVSGGLGAVVMTYMAKYF